MGPSPPPPTPLTQASSSKAVVSAPRAVPKAPAVSPERPAGALLAELVIYNGSPFMDHWAYFIRSSTDPSVGVYINAAGDVRNGFEIEIERNYNFDLTSRAPPKRIPLQWIDARYIDERAMRDNGVPKLDNNPVCPFEENALRVLQRYK